MKTAVAIALYNGARFLEKQLDTIRLQTRKPDHVVLCDDGSRDSTVELVQGYIHKYGLQDSWKLYINDKNLGYIRNFYRAMDLCDADLIFLSDQDDIWKNDKIEKMTKIMESHNEIKLLSCRYGIIDAQGIEQHSVVERKAIEDENLRKISLEDIMRAYRWPGMVMCVRKDFFAELLPVIQDCAVAHDLMLTVHAADRNGFFEYSYVGAYHRRHDNNTAREEHRVSKLLNMERKLTDIAITKKLWRNLAEADISISEQGKRQIRDRLELMELRETALQNKDMKSVIRIYKNDGGKYLRIASFLCDVWLVCFS